MAGPSSAASRSSARRLPSSRGKQRSVASFLGQLIRGERPYNQEFEAAILEAVRDTLSGEEQSVSEDWLDRTRQAIQQDNAARKRSRPLKAADLFNDLLATAQTAREHFIITSRPAEQVGSPRAESLRVILVERLGLIGPLQKPHPTLTRRLPDSDAALTKYTFCLPSEEAGAAWWQSLFGEIRALSRSRMRSFDADSMKQRIRALNEGGHLQVNSVPGFLCGCPVVVFDPESAVPIGFTLFYHQPNEGQSSVSVGKFDSEYLQEWKRLVYYPFVFGGIRHSPVSPDSALSGMGGGE